MLINWFQSTLGGGSTNTDHDSGPSRLVLQCCTNLLIAGVIKQILDKQAAVQDIFKVSLCRKFIHSSCNKKCHSLCILNKTAYYSKNNEII